MNHFKKQLKTPLLQNNSTIHIRKRLKTPPLRITQPFKLRYWQAQAVMSERWRMAMWRVARQMMGVSIGLLFLIALVHLQGSVSGGRKERVTFLLN
ncbi:MAG: hypothetical protein ACO24D_14390 [bacterium]